MGEAEIHNLFLSTLVNLAGRECWCVTCGEGTGSYVLFHIGEKIKREKPVNNRHLSDVVREYNGEYQLFIEGCAWRVECGNKIICSSNSDNRKEQEMVVGMSMLTGRKVQAAYVISDFYDLIVEFDSGFVLRTFTNSVDSNGDEYSVSTVQYTITVLPYAVSLEYEASDA